ncbi:MAG TPA: 2-oxoacid:ferredoxin oxidoreductase subunit gamma, partial [Syntrophorhabdus aromaticivorans]|nr:2-oxoacid:ferredoxin oxidoreductase subunit gamma [Syntrophorhabdus aromaticivorans]
EMVANIIALGAISKLTPIVSPKAIEAAVLARVPKGTEKLNRDALRMGMGAGQKAKKLVASSVVNLIENEDT